MWRALKPSVVYLDDCLDFGELVRTNRAHVLPAGALLLVLVETETLARLEHTYNCTQCLDLVHGEVVYHITNVESSSHGASYERIE